MEGVSLGLGEGLVDVLTIAAVVVSGVTDLRTRRILNVVTYPAIALGPVLQGGFWGWSSATGLGLEWSLLGLVVGALPFLVFNALDPRAFGMGDVKLMAAVGALKGFPFILGTLVYVALVGGLLAIVVLLWRGHLLETLGGLLRWSDGARREGRKEIYVPYGVAIAVGTVWALALELSHSGVV